MAHRWIRAAEAWADRMSDEAPDINDLPLPSPSWAPVDLGPYLNGTHKQTEPSVGLTRSDGLHLLYPGKEHTVIGEMECGKSWYASACAAAELTKAGKVVYIHFEEADPTDTIGRLRELGVLDNIIREQFIFIGPDEPVHPDRLDTILALQPTLAILDGVNEAMSLHMMGIRDEDGAAVYRRRLVKPFTAIGTTVLSADHVVKDREKRDRGPLGSIHKGNGLTGTLILLENVAAFGRGERGCSHVFITKDRPGYLRRHGRPSKLPGKTFMGSLIVDDTRMYVPFLELAFLEPKAKADDDSEPGSETTDDDRLLAAIVEAETAGRQMSMRAVDNVSPFGKEPTRNIIERLMFAKRLTKTIAGQAHIYSALTTPTSGVDRSPFPVPAPIEREPGTVTRNAPNRSRNGQERSGTVDIVPELAERSIPPQNGHGDASSARIDPRHCVDCQTQIPVARVRCPSCWDTFNAAQDVS